VWHWAGNEVSIAQPKPSADRGPDVVLACAGDTPTLEIVAAAWWLRRLAPELCVRVVNVIDLMTLFQPKDHPHGMSDDAFNRLFTADKPVVFAFHGYQHLIHQMLHHRSHPGRFHVRGFKEQGTTTTPFDMVILNAMSRFHLAAEAIRRSPLKSTHEVSIERLETMIADAVRYSRDELQDPPEIRDWVWSNETGHAP
jgi:xylulose-5-phosphate/fructose-6-phosphate phosphoketolase